MNRNRFIAIAALLVAPATARAQTSFWDFVGLSGSPAAVQGACPAVIVGVGAGAGSTSGASQGSAGLCAYEGVVQVNNAGFGNVKFNGTLESGQLNSTARVTTQWEADQLPPSNDDDEKGFGVCRHSTKAGEPGDRAGCYVGGEIGGTDNSNDKVWLTMDLTGLAAGSILNSIRLASINNENYLFEICSNSAFNSNCNSYGPANPNPAAGPAVTTVAINVADQSKRWVRFKGAISFQDYLVQGITTTVPEPGTMGLLATGLVALAGAGSLRRRNRNKK